MEQSCTAVVDDPSCVVALLLSPLRKDARRELVEHRQRAVMCASDATAATGPRKSSVADSGVVGASRALGQSSRKSPNKKNLHMILFFADRNTGMCQFSRFPLHVRIPPAWVPERIDLLRGSAW